ncbi:MAG: hypothetical protein CMG55_00640 [Candidatus Marinimicrobia bacterium]|nr:hypothetical protein [Candidatus Neomarinimicrobiota bacterium]
MKNYLLIFLTNISLSQNLYQGEVSFDYNGTVDGNFSSIVNDSLITGVTINQIIGDTSFLFLASMTQQDENNFDLFLAVLRDTVFPVQPRYWDIPGEGDESNPLSLESILIFMPELDSSFVTELFTIFTDTTQELDSSEILEDLFTSFSENLYLGLDGDFEITNVTDSSLSGTFNTVMLKPAFHFPPHTVSINNGNFIFNNVETPILNIKKPNIMQPTYFTLYHAYPNPFNPRTTIQFISQNKLKVFSASIYNAEGKQVKTLFQGPLEPGLHTLQWEPQNIANGIYFLTLQTNSSIQSKKLLYLK